MQVTAGKHSEIYNTYVYTRDTSNVEELLTYSVLRSSKSPNVGLIDLKLICERNLDSQKKKNMKLRSRNVESNEYDKDFFLQ